MLFREVEWWSSRPRRPPKRTTRVSARLRRLRKAAADARKAKRNDPRERVVRSVAQTTWRLLKPHLEACDTRTVWDILGTTKSGLILHLESQFSDGISWDNYGEWKATHVVPPRTAGRCILDLEDVANVRNVAPVLTRKRAA